MMRGVLIALLSLGVIAGIAGGIHRLGHYRTHRADFERHVADLCVQAALQARSSEARSR